MPKQDETPVSPFYQIAGLLFVFGILALPGFAWWPLAFVLPILAVLLSVWARRRDRQIALDRAGESICSFARSFDRSHTDPWIIRATYEVFAERFPIRSSDILENDLYIDDEDAEIMLEMVAECAGRSLVGTEANPLYGKVKTIQDLVMFLQHQPELEGHKTQRCGFVQATEN